MAINIPQPDISMLLVYGSQRPIQRRDPRRILSKLHRTTKRFKDERGQEPRHGVLLLSTDGGDPDAAYQIACTLRDHFETLTIVLPHRAKSAGTLLCIAADWLVMGPVSELGPLDVQIWHPQLPGRRVSALDVVTTMEQACQRGVEYARQVAEALASLESLDVSELCRASVEAGASLAARMGLQLDIVAWCEGARALRLAEEYAKRLLARRQAKGAQYYPKLQLQELVSTYPSHSFVIDALEASHLGFPVIDSKEYEFWSLFMFLFQQNPLEAVDTMLFTVQPFKPPEEIPQVEDEAVATVFENLENETTAPSAPLPPPGADEEKGDVN